MLVQRSPHIWSCRPICIITGSAGSMAVDKNAARSGAGKCPLVGISGHENKSNFTEIRDWMSGSGERWLKRIKREKNELELLENQELCAIPCKMESKWRAKRGWKHEACRYKDPKRICRGKLVCLQLPFISAYFMFE